MSKLHMDEMSSLGEDIVMLTYMGLILLFRKLETFLEKKVHYEDKNKFNIFWVLTFISCIGVLVYLYSMNYLYLTNEWYDYLYLIPFIGLIMEVNISYKKNFLEVSTD